MAIAEERSPSRVWGLGVRQVVFMALGAALYAGLSYATNILQIPGAGNVSLRPGIVIPLFFGAVFGPWVGLFTGVIGNLIGDLLTGYGLVWNWDLGNGLIGFIAGLAMFMTWGRYNTARNIIIAEIFAAIGVVVGIGFAAYTDIFIYKNTLAYSTFSEFIPAGLSDLVNGLILLPILLIAYNAAIARRGHA